MAGTSMSVGSGYSVGQMVKGGYRIEEMLGKGGMGAVFEVVHVETGKKYALKTLFPEYIDQPGYKERFKREAGVMASLTHPNIVRIIDFNADNVPFLIMERLYGMDLTHRIQEAGRLTFGQSLEILDPVVRALGTAHNMPRPIIHRDLKPDNIFLCDDGRVKLLDFGIAKKLDSGTVVTMDGAIMGTMNFMSPEQALGEVRQIDQRTDIFALGAILYQMLSGRYAFDGQGVGAVLSKILHEDPIPLAELPNLVNVPAGVQAVLDRALAKNKSDRYPTVIAFLNDLQDIGQGKRPAARSANIRPASAAPRTMGYGDRPAAASNSSSLEYEQLPSPTNGNGSLTQGTLDESSAFDYVSSVHLPPMRRKSHAGLIIFLGMLAVAGGGATASYYTRTPPQFRRFVDRAVAKLRGKKIKLKPIPPPEPMKIKPKKRSRRGTHRRYKKHGYNRRGTRRR